MLGPPGDNRRGARRSMLEQYGTQLGTLVERRFQEAALIGARQNAEEALEQARQAVAETEKANDALKIEIAQRIKAHEDLEYLANHDQLTDLPNRTLFTDRLETLIEAARRSGQTVGLMFLDLDHFKDVNDTLGHAVGDDLLKMVARRLRDCVRSEDTVARLGGDEFAVIQVGLNYPIDAHVQAKRIVDALSRPFQIDRHKLYSGTSIGITVYPADADGSEQLQKNADLAMYLAKDSQRNTFRFFDAELNAAARRRSYLEQQLRIAIEENHFAVYFQPKIHLQDERVAGAEALVRWHHPEQGMINPEEFIPIAERTGLINPIGEFMLRAACTYFKGWHDGDAPKINLAVNLSAAQFMDRDIPAMVREVLAETGFEAQYLELEITESAVMQDLRNADDVLKQLQEIGVSISIDDFGTGYSSLSYLRQLPVQRIKIDKSFIGEVDTDEAAAAIARTIIMLGKSLDLEIVAEGIEKPEHAKYLRELGCDEGQGYYYSRPLPAENFIAFVLDWEARAAAA